MIGVIVGSGNSGSGGHISIVAGRSTVETGGAIDVVTGTGDATSSGSLSLSTTHTGRTRIRRLDGHCTAALGNASARGERDSPTSTDSTLTCQWKLHFLHSVK